MIEKKTANVSPEKYNQKVALSDVCRTYNLGQEWLAMVLGKSQPTISNWLDPKKPDFPCFDDWNTLVRIIKQHTGSIEPIRSLCNWHGTDVVSLSSEGVSLDPKTLGRLTSILAKKGGTIISLCVQVLEDGVIDEVEEGQLDTACPDIEALYVAVGELRERARTAHHAQKVRQA